jgi:quercetin dioxygenase-like cupin family protein
MMPDARRLPGMFLILAMLMAMTGLTVSAQDNATPAATPAPSVVREIINEGEPASAPGEILQLVQYTIPGNIALPPHTHPGMQVNVVVSGTLTYTVVEGSIEITRADGTEETLSSGETTDFVAGDTFTEPEGMVHFGVNTHDEPIVLLTASLFEEDEAPSTVVQASPAATAAATPAS